MEITKSKGHHPVKAIVKLGKSVDARVVALLAVLTTVFFWKILFTDEYSILTGGDNARQWVPWYQFASRWIKHGVLPLWDPFSNGGQPFAGDAQPGLFYPVNLLLFLIGGSASGLASKAIELAVVFSSFLLAAFQYWLCRTLRMSPFASLVSSICYAFAGFTGTIFFGHIGMFNSCIWTPPVFLFFLKSSQAGKPARRVSFAMTSGLCIGLGLLAGNVVPPLYSAVVVVAFALYLSFVRENVPEPGLRRFFRLSSLVAAAGITAAGVAAVQLLPSAEYARLAVRWVDAAEPVGALRNIPYTLEGAFGTFPPYALLGFLLPGVAHLTNMYVYVGILPLMLAFLGAWSRSTHSRFFTFLLVISLLYMLGNGTIVHGLLYAAVPFLFIARLALRALFVLHFALAVLAGFGTDYLTAQMQAAAPGKAIRFLLKSAASFTFLLGAMMALLSTYYFLEGKVGSRAEALNTAYFFLLMLALSTVVLYAGIGKRVSEKAFRGLVIAVLALDVFSPVSAAVHSKRDFDGIANLEPDQYYRKNRIVTHLLSDPDRYFRVYLPSEKTPPYGDAFELFTINGVAPTTLSDFFAFRSSGWLNPNNLNLLNVKYIVAEQDIPGWQKVADEGKTALYCNHNYLQRVFLVPSARFAASDREALEVVNSKEFDPRSTVIFDVRDKLRLPERTASSDPEGGARWSDREVKIEDYAPDRIELAVDAPSDCFLFMSEVVYPGWKAVVDGRPQPIYKGDSLFRTLALTKGVHKVRLDYSPSSFFVGLLITCASLLLFSLSWVWGQTGTN